ncbi:hypothetical protein [Allokutzneria albata]|uniref:Uncharacterized protein n=1 Tax=Allokutzneria albata TaxID=211114 RepID=A0A1G9SBY2_ALLAB|nr:hypothetical protein [Allokutzneria albata]SDM32939.1 hypothetical protein SAMN04489726_1052 [Allokutzneria albata]
MRSTRGKVGTVALLTLSTMFLSALPAMAATDDRIYDGWDVAGAENSRPSGNYKSVISLCDEELDGNSVYAEFYTYGGARIDLSDAALNGCARRTLWGEHNQIRSFRIREEGGAWSPLAILDKA